MQNKLKDNSVGIIVPKIVEIKHNLELDCGKNLENFSLVYETYGKLNSNKDNAITTDGVEQIQQPLSVDSIQNSLAMTNSDIYTDQLSP